MKFFLALIVIFSIVYGYFEYEEYKIEKIDYAIGTFCKRIGFNHKANEIEKSPKSYQNCKLFLSENKEFFLETLRIHHNLYSLRYLYEVFSGEWGKEIRQLNNTKTVHYDDLLSMNFFTEKMSGNYRLIKVQNLKEQPINSFVQINGYIDAVRGGGSKTDYSDGSDKIQILGEFLIDFNHKHFTYDQFEQIEKRCHYGIWPLCPANIYIEIKECEDNSFNTECFFSKKEFKIVGIKFLKRSFIELIIQKSSGCLNNKFFEKVKESQNFELVFGKTLMEKASKKVSCQADSFDVITKDIPMLNSLRQKYPFILEDQNKILEHLEIKTDPSDGNIKLSVTGKVLAQNAKRKVALDNIEKEKELEKAKMEKKKEIEEMVKKKIKKYTEGIELKKKQIKENRSEAYMESEIYKDLNSDIIKD